MSRIVEVKRVWNNREIVHTVSVDENDIRISCDLEVFMHRIIVQTQQLGRVQRLSNDAIRIAITNAMNDAVSDMKNSTIKA